MKREGILDMQKNMYPLSVKQWNPFVGCDFHCVYCLRSFQQQLKRFSKCPQCLSYEPHWHKDRLLQKMPKTRYMQFIFANSCADVSFAEPKDFCQQLEFIESWKTRTFLIQSKNPSYFKQFEGLLPENLIIGTTIETDDFEITSKISKAPKPLFRYQALRDLKHQPKMLTIEPVLKFHLDEMITYAKDINPTMIWLGYDSKNCKLPEPSRQEVMALHWHLSRLGIPVFLKTIRKAWWEK